MATNVMGYAPSSAGSGIFDALNAMGDIQAKYNQQHSANDAATAANTGIGAAIASTGQIFDKTSALTAPYSQAGYQQISNLQNLQKAPLDVNSFLDPSMDFTMKKGADALERSAAARGGVLSGATLKDIADYSSGLASTNYQNAVTNAMNNRAAQAGIGEALYAGGVQATNTQASAGLGTQEGLAQLYTAQGANTASGIVSSNATGGNDTINNTLENLKAGKAIWDTVSSWW